MSGEQLFRILGLVDDDLIQEAASGFRTAPAIRRGPWRRLLAACACLAVACGAGFALRAGFGPMGGTSGDGAAPGSNTGSGITLGGDPEEAATDNEPLSVDGTTFMSYAGPVFPLTTAEPDTGLTAERKITWDFTTGTYQDGSPRQWGTAVTDGYTLTNPTEETITVTALYPFAGSFDELAELGPTAAVDGAAVESTLYAGAYAGGFQGTGGDDTTTLNLAYPDSWTDYRALLESGAYQAQALGEAPPLDIPVTVYEFSDFQAPHEQYRAATQAISFTIDREKTTVLTYGFDGFGWDEQTGCQQHSYFVPDGIRREKETKLLVVMGEDIEDYTLQGYQDGGCDAGEEIDGVSCTVTRRETTLGEELDRICQSYLSEYASYQYGMDDHALEALPYPLFRRAVAELLAQYGILAGNGMVDRYSDGRLDDIISETMVHERVLYLAVPVTVPAGGIIDITFEFWKGPSFDYGCSGSESKDLQGYDLVTRLGTTLEFTAQTAALANTENIEIVRQNLGFAPENGVTEVPLDLTQEHYYLEIRPKA